MKKDFEMKELSDNEIEGQIKELKQQALVYGAKERFATSQAEELLRPWWKWWRREDADLLYWAAFLSKRKKEETEATINELEMEMANRIRHRLAM